MNNYVKTTSDLYTTAMYGKNAIHIPFNAVIQNCGKQDGFTVALIIGQSSSPLNIHPIQFQSKMTHQLVLGDAIIRPHIVLESNAFQGYGASGLLKMPPMEWLEKDHNIILNTTGDLDKRINNKYS